jgi:hypothetical protein
VLSNPRSIKRVAQVLMMTVLIAGSVGVGIVLAHTADHYVSTWGPSNTRHWWHNVYNAQGTLLAGFNNEAQYDQPHSGVFYWTALHVGLGDEYVEQPQYYGPSRVLSSSGQYLYGSNWIVCNRIYAIHSTLFTGYIYNPPPSGYWEQQTVQGDCYSFFRTYHYLRIFHRS